MVSEVKSNSCLQQEVKFCNLNNELKEPRKRLISSGSSDFESSASDKFKKTTSHRIPDGGYGWIIVLSSLVVSLIADGISFSFGLIYTELLDYFKESKSKTAWIGSLFLAVPLLVGPIMSNLVDKYGCRKMTIIGGVVSSAGFALSAICQSVEMLYLTFGIISGIGLGIGYVTAVVSIAFWFDKKRTFATGIGASGTGIGTFLYAPFTQWLIEYYGWRGATLILAGTMLHTCVFGALMRDPDWLIEENKLESCSQSVTTFSSSSVCLDEIKRMLETGVNKEAVLDTLVTNYNTEANQQVLNNAENGSLKKYQSEMLLPTFWVDKHESNNFVTSHRSLCHTNSNMDPKAIWEKNNLGKKASIISLNYSSSTDDNLAFKKHTYSRFSLNENVINNLNWKDVRRQSKSNQKNSRRHNSLNYILNDTSPNEEVLLINEIKEINLHKSNKDAVINIPENISVKINDSKKAKMNEFKKNLRMNKSNLRQNLSIRNSNFLKNMRIHRNSINYRGALLNTHRYRLRASSCPNIFRNSMTTIAKEDEDVSLYFKFIT